MKRFLALCGLVLCLAACDSSRNTEVNPPVVVPPEAPSTDVGPPLLTTPSETCDLEIQVKRWSNFAAAPSFYFSWNNGFTTPQVMTQIVPSLYTHTVAGVPSNDFYTVNIDDPNFSGGFIFGDGGLKSGYGDKLTIIRVNGVQLFVPEGDDMRLELDENCNVVTQRVTRVFRWVPPPDWEIANPMAFIKMDKLYAFNVSFIDGAYQATLTNVPVGRVEANICFLNLSVYAGTADCAVSGLTNTLRMNGVITFDGVFTDTLVKYVSVIYDPNPLAGELMLYMEGNNFLDITPDGVAPVPDGLGAIIPVE